jgi:hypothetical protein
MASGKMNRSINIFHELKALATAAAAANSIFPTQMQYAAVINCGEYFISNASRMKIL